MWAGVMQGGQAEATLWVDQGQDYLEHGGERRRQLVRRHFRRHLRRKITSARVPGSWTAFLPLIMTGQLPVITLVLSIVSYAMDTPQAENTVNQSSQSTEHRGSENQHRRVAACDCGIKDRSQLKVKEV